MALSRRTQIATETLELSKVSAVSLSADRRSAIFTAQYTDCKTGKSYTDAWVAPIHTGEPEHFSRQNQPADQPRWLKEITRKA